MKLIKDLGREYINKTSKRKAQFGIYECPSCLREFRAYKYEIAKGQQGCRNCANQRNASRHGVKNHRLYSVFANMKSRCYDNKNAAYINYGAKGVTVCKEWLDNPAKFIKWAEENGWKEGLEIDKDELSDKQGITPLYSPDTCQFVTKSYNVAYANARRQK